MRQLIVDPHQKIVDRQAALLRQTITKVVAQALRQPDSELAVLVRQLVVQELLALEKET